MVEPTFVPISVHLACNDERGNFASEVTSIELYSGQVHELTVTVLEAFRLSLEPFHLRIVDPHDGVGLALRTLSSTPAKWVGNMAWDAVGMPLEEASKLVRFAVERGFWLDEWTSDGWLAGLVAELDALERRGRERSAGSVA